MKRNPNGSGSIIRLKGNRAKPFMAKKTTGWDRTVNPPKQIIKVVGYYATYDEASYALVEYNRKGGIDRSDMTLADVYKEWSLHFDKISDSSINQYINAFKRLQGLHNVKFVNLRTADYQRIINSHGELKRGTLAKIKIILTMMYNYAMMNDVVNKNYAQFIELPKEKKTEKEPFNSFEMSILWENTHIQMVKNILILIYTGERIMEMLPLNIFNVVLHEKHPEGERNYIKTGSKTEAGKNRTIPIHDKILPFIIELCENSKDGKLFNVNYTQFRYAFNLTMADLNIKNKTPHSCRHTFVSMLKRQGAELKATQKLAGHKDAKTTIDVYSHVEYEELQHAVNLLN